MNEYVEKALLHLTGKSNINSVSIEELEHIVYTYPYFSVAQVLLAKKLKAEQSDVFLPQLQKTALYFNNPYWLHYQLLDQEPTFGTPKKTVAAQPLLLDEEVTEDTSGLHVTESGLIELAPPAPAALIETDTSFDEDVDAPVTEESAKAETNDEASEHKNEIETASIQQDESTTAQLLRPEPEEAAGFEEAQQVTSETQIESSWQEKQDLQEASAFPIQEVELKDDVEPDSSTSSDQATEPDFIFANQDLKVRPQTNAEGYIRDAEAPELHENVEATPEPEVSEISPKEHSEQNSASDSVLEVSNPQEQVEADLQSSITPEDYEQQPANIPENFARLDQPHFEENRTNNFDVQLQFASDQHTPLHQDMGSENFAPVPDYNDPLSTDYNNQYQPQEDTIEEFAPEDFLQQPPLEKNIHELDNPLVATNNLEDSGEVNELAAEEDEIALDQWHPEQEEILEEIEQEKANEEEAKEASPAVVEGPQQDPQLTLPVHEEDSQIIDEFVEAQHEQKSTSADEIGVPVVTAEQPNEAAAPVANEPLIPIEPYHTIDYFASQGIKLTLDKDPKDKLGKQLKSFTQWLRHMKKLGPEDAIKNEVDDGMETKIQGIADSSNTPQDVVTEAMADVLLKQGKTQQAVEVYIKLSFLNPDKSAYFADQIQKIKR